MKSTPLLTTLDTFADVEVLGRGVLEIDSAAVPRLFAQNLTIDGAGSVVTGVGRDLAGLRLSVSGTLSLSWPRLSLTL